MKNYGKTYCSPKSFNNHLGVPISLSNLSFDDNYGIFEVGMSNAGEIKNLTKFIQPHIGIITNIGEAHLENFKNIKGIAKAKSEIIENIKKGGTIILNRDDKFFNYLNKKANLYNLEVITFGKHKKSYVQLKKIIKKSKISKIFVVGKSKFNFQVGDVNVYNILASLALLNKFKIDIKKLNQNLKISSLLWAEVKNI